MQERLRRHDMQDKKEKVVHLSGWYKWMYPAYPVKTFEQLRGDVIR